MFKNRARIYPRIYVHNHNHGQTVIKVVWSCSLPSQVLRILVSGRIIDGNVWHQKSVCVLSEHAQYGKWQKTSLICMSVADGVCTYVGLHHTVWALSVC